MSTNNLKNNSILYILDGKYNKSILKINKINNNNKFNAKILFKKVKLLPNELLNSVGYASQENFKLTVNNNNSNIIKINDIVYIPDGKYKGYLLGIIRIKENGHYDTVELRNDNNEIYRDIKIISNNYLSKCILDNKLSINS